MTPAPRTAVEPRPGAAASAATRDGTPRRGMVATDNAPPPPVPRCEATPHREPS